MIQPLVESGVHLPPCPKCTRINGACSLRCPTVNLPEKWAFMTIEEKYGAS